MNVMGKEMTRRQGHGSHQGQHYKQDESNLISQLEFILPRLEVAAFVCLRRPAGSSESGAEITVVHKNNHCLRYNTDVSRFSGDFSDVRKRKETESTDTILRYCLELHPISNANLLPW